MSETITVDTEPQIRTRAAAQERVMSEPATPAAAIDDTPIEHVDPDAALAEVQQSVQRKDAQIAELRQREGAARSAAANAQQQVAAMQQARHGDYAATVDQAMVAATADQARWRTAYVAAREAGDFNAEAAAQEGMADARYRLNNAAREKQRLGTAAPRQDQGTPRPAPQQDGGGYTPAARAWIDEHPRFNSDSQFKAIAMAAHQTAVDDGIAPDSRAYFRHIEDTLARAGYSDQNAGGGNAQMTNGTRQPPPNSTAAPPNRGGAGNGSAANGGMVRTPLGDVRVSRSNGKLNIQIPQHLRADWEEGAKITDPHGYAADPKKSLAEYAHEQVMAGEEMARGGNPGYTTEQGRTYK